MLELGTFLFNTNSTLISSKPVYHIVRFHQLKENEYNINYSLERHYFISWTFFELYYTIKFVA